MATVRSIEYKFVETMTVTDDMLTTIVNEWCKKGWAFDSIQFAMSSSSKRPSMAFVGFSRPLEVDLEGDDDGRGDAPKTSWVEENAKQSTQEPLDS